jgi:predicted N-acyltransferase
MAIYAKTLRSLSQIDGAEWDAIVPPHATTRRYGYLRALESSRINDCVHRYLVCYSPDGRLLAHAPFFSMTTPVDMFWDPDWRSARLLAKVRRNWPTALHVKTVECGSPTVLGHAITLAVNDEVTRAAFLSQLHQALQDFADDQGASSITVRDFHEWTLEQGRGLVRHGYRTLPNLPDTILRIVWRTFDEYVASLRKKYRYLVRTERRRMHETGVKRVVANDLRPHAEAMAALWKQTSVRSKGYHREVLGADYFANLSACVIGSVTATLFVRDAELLAFTLYLVCGHVLVSHYIGVDYRYNKSSALVFNAYYDMIERAIQMGNRYLRMGNTSYQLKQRMGADLAPLTMYAKHRHSALTPAYAWWFERFMPPPPSVRARSVFRGAS